MARQGPPASSRALGKVPAMQLVTTPLVETDEELAQQLQEEEVAAEEEWLGRDASTLEVVMEAATPLMWGQLEGFGALAEQVVAPFQVTGLSQPSAAVAVQPLVVVAT